MEHRAVSGHPVSDRAGELRPGAGVTSPFWAELVAPASRCVSTSTTPAAAAHRTPAAAPATSNDSLNVTGAASSASVDVVTILGVLTLLAVLALLVPGFARVKEWAYAGVMFDLIGAAASHLAVACGRRRPSRGSRGMLGEASQRHLLATID